MTRDTLNMLTRLHDAGISNDDALALRRIAMTLHRWFELECGTGDSNWTHSIERDGDEDNSPPYMRHQGHVNGKWIDHRHRIQDRETGARKRLVKLIARYPGFAAYVQTDPRGAPLYVLTPYDMERYKGQPVDQIY